MDGKKKSFLLLWIGKVWGKPVKSITELHDGCFFLHVMRAISHWSGKVGDLDDANAQTKILTVKKFLQDFYGTEDFNGVLNFDGMFCDDYHKREMELAKVAVVLLGVALIDKQGGEIVQKASMELPDHMHADVVGLLEAVVQMNNGPKFILSSRIEEALQMPSEEQGDIALASWFRMPKFECLTPQECNSNNVSGASLLEGGISTSPPTTPLAHGRKGSSDLAHNASFGIGSPFRDININSVSPFVTYIQSPQLIRKAILKEKEMELRQLKAQLNEEILMKEDVQLSLKDQVEESAKKDSEINDLKNRIRELQFLQDAHDELQELKPRHAELEVKCDKFVSRQQKLDQYKSECRMLEKETTSQRDEIQSLHHEIQSLKAQYQEKSESLKAKNSLEKQMNLMKVQMEESNRMKSLMEEELMSAKSNLQMTEEKYKELKKLTEECNEESFQGESMDVVTDIQLGEMKSQVDRLSQEKEDFQAEIDGLKSTIVEQNSFLEEMKKLMESSQQMNESLVTQLRGKCTDIESLKSEMDERETNNKNASAAMKTKHENDFKVLHLENEKKVLSLVEGHEVAVKRFHTATEKVSLEKDSVVQEMKELGERMRILQENHTKEIDILKVESDKQLACQKSTFERDIVALQEQNETRKDELIAENKQHIKHLQDIGEQKLLLEKEEHEIHLMKVKDDLLSEIKSQRFNFESQIAELQEMGDKTLREKDALDNEIVRLRNDVAMTLESEKVEKEEEMKKLKEEQEKQIVDMHSQHEMEMSTLQENSESQVKSLGEELSKLKKEHANSLERLQKEHENLTFELNEKLASTVQQYEKEYGDLQSRIQDSDGQKTNLEDVLVKLKETTAASLEEQRTKHANEISVLQQEHSEKVESMEQEHRLRIEQFGTREDESLARQNAAISKLHDEINGMTNEQRIAGEQMFTFLNDQADLKNQFAHNQQEMSRIVSEKCAVEDKLRKVEEDNLEMMVSKASLEERVGSLLAEKSELVSKTENMEDQLSQLEEEKSEITINTSALEEQVGMLLKEKSELVSKTENIEDQLRQLEEEKSEITINMSALEEQVGMLLKEKSELMSKTENMEDQLRQLEEEKSEITINTSALEEQVGMLLKEKSELVSKTENMEDQLRQLEEEKSEITINTSALEEQVGMLSKEKSELVSKTENMEDQLRQLEEEKSEITINTSALEEQVGVLSKEKSELVSKTENMEDQLRQLEEEKSEITINTTSLEEQVRLLLKEKSELVSKTENMEDQCRELEEEKSELLSAKISLEEGVAELCEKNSNDHDEYKELSEQMSDLQSQYSDVLSARSVAEEKLNILSQEKLELASQIETVQEKVMNMQQENSELSSQKTVVENEVVLLQEKLLEVSTQKSCLEKEFATLQFEKSDITCQKTFIGEELSCLRQENSEVLSQKSLLEEKVASLQQEISEITSLKESVEKEFSHKEHDYETLQTENQMKLVNLEEEMHLSLQSLTDKHDIAMSRLQGETDEKMCALNTDHRAEIARVEEEKEMLMKEISVLRNNLNSTVAEVKQAEAAMVENENLASNFQKATLEKLEQERKEHTEFVAKIKSEADEMLSFEKAELEEIVVSRMNEEMNSRILLMKNEYDELNVKLQEAADAMACEKEEHSKVLAKVQEETEMKVAEFEKLISTKEKEMIDTLALQVEEKEKLEAKLNEEKISQEALVARLREEADEALNCEKQHAAVKLEEDLRAVEEEKSVLAEELLVLQKETTKMMQLQKGEHERERQSLQETGEAKIAEVIAQYRKEVEDAREELKEAGSRHESQLEDEVAKVRQETEMTFEANLDELKLQFEAAKESELKALSDQKADLSAMKEQFEEELKSQQTKMEQKLKEMQEENKQLRERETAMLKKMESQMSTANEFCDNLRQQLEAAKREGNSASRERIQLYEKQLMKQKETNASLNKALQIEKETSGKMQQRLEAHIAKHVKTKAMLDNAQKEARVYAIENNRVKTSLDYSERQLRNYKNQLEQAGNALLGSDAHFKRIIEENDSMNDSLDANTSLMSSYSLRSTTSTGSVRSRGSAKSDDGSPNETIISADSVMMRRETLAGSSDLRKKAPPPGFKAAMLSCDNEPEEFEWDRLSELKRRNTLCLPHMKSSYPVETQTKKEAGSDEQAVRLSMMPADMSTLSTKPVKRRSPRLSMVNPDEEDKTTCPNKKGKEETSGGTTIYFPLALDGAVYQPPTRSTTDKQKLVASGIARKKLTPSKLTKSPGKLVTRGRSYKSPGIRGRSPVQPRHAAAAADENMASVSFSIGFTPKKSNVGRSRLMQKKPVNHELATKMSEMKLRSSPRQKARKPLATRNYRETGI